MDSKRIVGIVMLLAACLFGILLSTAYLSTQEIDETPFWWKGLRATGRIQEMAHDRITIKPEEGKDMTFAINSLTRISLFGKTSLDKNTLVKITYKAYNDTTTMPLARMIRELPEKGKTSGSPAPEVSPGHENPGPSGTPQGADSATPAPSVQDPGASPSPSVQEASSPSMTPSSAVQESVSAPAPPSGTPQR